jgi:hypothetical protein
VREHLVAHDGVSHLQNTAFPSDKKIRLETPVACKSTAFSFPIPIQLLIKIMRNEDELNRNLNIKKFKCMSNASSLLLKAQTNQFRRLQAQVWTPRSGFS